MADAAYKTLRSMEVFFTAVQLIFLKALYGPNAIKGPASGFGPRLSIKIRAGGTLRHGRIVSRANFSIFCDGGNVTIGDGTFFNNSCSLNCMNSISIGSDTLFGEGVRIYDHDHALDDDNRPMKSKFNTQPISIGNNCWIGSNVTILKGVHICDRVTIGAGAVVRESIAVPGIYAAKGLTQLSKIK